LKPALLALAAVALCSPAAAQNKSMKLPVLVPQVAPVAPEPVHRYRVSITGFVVEEQTWDDAMQRDGKDDEVFLLAEVRQINGNDGAARVGRPETVRSMVMGDVNGFQPEERLRAGHASEDGGLRTGDKVGTTGARRGEPRGDRIPLRLWEGELHPGMGVMIVPTIWEWDGEVTDIERIGRNLLGPLDAIGSAGFDWAGSEPGKHIDSGKQFPQFASSGELRRYSETEVGRNVVGTNVVQEHSVVGTRADRPIGMELVAGSYRFDPWVLMLGHGNAGILAHNESGFGPGVIPLPYIDSPALHGRYQLYLQVEEIQ